ncbi:MAG TPA: metallophosphoesterase [Anaerolineaceae bacterium]|nr:metallophosphoesterase [Anaerolineaceae bacterium]
MKPKSGFRIKTILITLLLITGLVTGDMGLVFAKNVGHAALGPKSSPDLAPGLVYLGNLGTIATKTSATELQITTEQTVNAGNDIFVALGTDPNSSLTVAVTDNAGNSYTQVELEINTGNIRTYLFGAYDVNAMPIGSKITISMSVAVTAHAAVAALFDGLTDENALDQLASSNQASSSTPASGMTGTTTQADELLIGVIGTEGPVGDSAGTWENLFLDGPRTGTTGGTDDTNISISLGYRIVSTTGTYTAAKSGITARDWAAIIGTFKMDLVVNRPRINLNATLTDFLCLPGGVSAEQSYTVSGTNLTENIHIIAPTDFKVSLSSGSGFVNELTLTQTDGNVAQTTVYVRFGKTSEGISTGNIQNLSAGATTRNIPVKGTAAPINPVNFNIMLGRPTDHSITANIITDYDAEFYIDYGDASGIYTDDAGPFTVTGSGTSPSYPITPIEIVIDGLTANARHYYRIRYRRVGITDWNLGAENSFMTQRAPGQPFVFTIISDSHLGQYGGQTADELELYRTTISNIITDNPDFHIDTGDTFAMDPSPLGSGMTDAEGSAAYYVERPFLGPLTDSAPFFFVLGNHENEEGWNFDDVFTAPDQSLAIVGMKNRKLMYPNPIPDDFYTGNTDMLDTPIGGDGYHEDYFAWQWGDALFVVIDPYHYSMTWPNDNGEGYGGEGQDGEASGDRWDWSLGIQQYLWFKQTLENSTAKYKFVFSHHVTGGSTVYGRGGKGAVELFEWGGKNADGTWGWDTHRPASEGWTLPVHQLMVDSGVDIYFHGHDHMYAYEEVDGIAYVEVPKPDDAGYTWDPYSYGYNENLYPEAQPILQNSGHLRVSVGTNQVLVEYVRSYLPGDGSNGNISHSFTVPISEPVGKLGDVNGDDAADSTDALIMLSGDAGLNIKTYCPINCGDVNKDGLVNSTDALIILSFDVGMTVPYEIEEPGCMEIITPPSGCTLP